MVVAKYSKEKIIHRTSTQKELKEKRSTNHLKMIKKMILLEKKEFPCFKSFSFEKEKRKIRERFHNLRVSMKLEHLKKRMTERYSII